MWISQRLWKSEIVVRSNLTLNYGVFGASLIDLTEDQKLG
jgi:hypothetical protein